MTEEPNRVHQTLIEIEKMYSTGLLDHGRNPRSVGWKDLSSQTMRFDKLSQVITSLPGSEITVNDLGCGYGSLFAYLEANTKVKLTAYYGYDISESMLEAAQLETDGRAVLLNSPEPTKTADYSFASGPFNVKGEATDEQWQTYVQESLLSMAARSRLGIAFNLLTSYVDFRQANLFYADPCRFFDFCKKNISPFVTLVHDYPLYEWTMLVHLDKQNSGKAAQTSKRSE